MAPSSATMCTGCVDGGVQNGTGLLTTEDDLGVCAWRRAFGRPLTRSARDYFQLLAAAPKHCHAFVAVHQGRSSRSRAQDAA
eukprot:15445575-Alexandrium_andersonii.AAC.1